MELTDIPSMEVYEAVKDKTPDDFFFCTELGEWGDVNHGTCGNHCKEYSPRNGKSGCCKHYSKLSYSAGEKVILIKNGLNNHLADLKIIDKIIP